jgi:hypothetical protein
MRLLSRLAAFLALVLLAYLIVAKASHLLFAPDLEVLRVHLPAGVTAGESDTLGVVVHNRGSVTGAAFVVAVLADGFEVEGATLVVPPGDSLLVPVALKFEGGLNFVSLLAFDGWRGARRLETFRDLSVPVAPREIPPEEVTLPARASRGDSLPVVVPWTNLGMTSETVVPVVVFRPENGGLPLDITGPAEVVAPGEEKTLAFALDSWPLAAGSYRVQIFLNSARGGRIARASAPLALEVSDR